MDAETLLSNAQRRIVRLSQLLAKQDRALETAAAESRRFAEKVERLERELKEARDLYEANHG